MTWNELHDLIETMSAGEREKSAVVFDEYECSFHRVETCNEFDASNAPGENYSMNIKLNEWGWYQAGGGE